MSTDPVVPSEGWGVLHLYFHVRREVTGDPHFDADTAARDFARRVRAFAEREDHQALMCSVVGQKADLGVLALCPDLVMLDAFAGELAASPLGQALAPAGSYLSLTELSEYTPTRDDEARRLVAEEGLEAGTTAYEEALESFTERMRAYAEHRLHPSLPDRRVVAFYPMSKRREGADNWYVLPFEERKRLMGGHAQVGRRYRGRVLQLITGSVGLDDWEWGVTLLADDPKAIRDIVYEMRFDEVSARYGEFGPFVTGLVMAPDTLLRHLGLASAAE